MVVVTKVYCEAILTAEKIARHKEEVERRHALPEAVLPCSLSLSKIKEKEATKEENHRLEAYLVDNGMRDKALKKLEGSLGPLASNSALEAALRRRFARFDHGGTGNIDYSDFDRLLVALKDPRPKDDVDKQLTTRLHVDEQGHISYLAFIDWWLDNNTA